MKPTQSEKLQNLKRTETEIRERIKGLKGQLPGLANDPSFNQLKMNAIHTEIVELNEQLRQASIAVKQAEIELLETE